MYRDSQRGMGLIGTLVLALLIFMLALAVSGAGLFHLNLSSRSTSETVAQDLAESAVARVVERILEQEDRTGNLDYGEDQTATVRVERSDSLEGAFGLATFDPDYSDPEGTILDPCFNNLQSDSSVEATNGTVIPKESLYVVGYGICGSVERRVEAVIYLPRFPYSVACQGSFRGSDLLIAGVREETVVEPGVAVPEELLEPGHLVSNSTAGSAAIELGGRSRVKGNLKSVSGANLGPEATVDGELLLHSPPAEIPTIDLEQYRPTTDDVFQGLLSLERGLVLDRTAYFEAVGSPMTLLEGLTLEGGFLFVDGDLEIQGGVSGQGAIVVTGDLSITGSGQLTTDNVAAFLAGGNVTIQGSGTRPRDSVIEGLVYAGGRASVRDITLVGTLISAGEQESVLQNSIFLERDRYGAIEIVGVDTSTWQDPTQWEAVDFDLTPNLPPGAILSYRVSSSGGFDASQINADLARSFEDLEFREAEETAEELEDLEGPETEGRDDFGASGGVARPWVGYLVVAPVSHLQTRTVVTSAPTSETVTDVVRSETLLSIDLSDFVTPMERMRVKWWRNL